MLAGMCMHLCVCRGLFVHMLVRKILCYGESTGPAVVKHSPALAGLQCACSLGLGFPGGRRARWTKPAIASFRVTAFSSFLNSK